MLTPGLLNLSMAERLRVGVLISGSGSNLQALIDACAAPDYPALIALVISNQADAYGLERARMADIPAVVIPQASHSSRSAFDSEIDAQLRAHAIDIVCLAGFMRILTPEFVSRWQGRMINIHPSLLPHYKGLNTHARVLAAGDPVHGCTVHHVVPELDGGPIILQSKVAVLPGDTVDTLAARVQQQEHIIFPAALKLLCQSQAPL